LADYARAGIDHVFTELPIKTIGAVAHAGFASAAILADYARARIDRRAREPVSRVAVVARARVASGEILAAGVEITAVKSVRALIHVRVTKVPLPTVRAETDAVRAGAVIQTLNVQAGVDLGPA
jgi:hypothetical protein